MNELTGPAVSCPEYLDDTMDEILLTDVPPLLTLAPQSRKHIDIAVVVVVVVVVVVF